MADDCSGILSSYAGFYWDDVLLSWMAHVRITITCLEKGDAAGKVVVCPRSFKDLKEIGVERYGAPYARVLSIEGVEIHDIRGVKDGHRIDFSRKASLIEEKLRGPVEDEMILIIDSREEELEEELGGQVEDGMIDESLGEERDEFGGNEGETEQLVGQDMEHNVLVTTGLEATARNADLAANVADVDEKELHGSDPTWKDILISDICSLVVGICSFVEEMRKEMRIVNEPEM